MTTVRKMIRLIAWPDPLVQERLEDIGFFYDAQHRTWIRFCNDDEAGPLGEWLKRHRLRSALGDAVGQGQLTRHPKLSASLLLKNGGGPTVCALCGVVGVPCRQWIEGDDTDSTDYAAPAKFYLCGQCVQQRMQPHPRLYAPAEDQL